MLPRRATSSTDAGLRSEEEDAQLILPARLIEEALQQDDFRLRLDEVLAPGQGSADYDRTSAQFDVAHLTSSLPQALQGELGTHRYSQEGILTDIQRMWKSFDERLLLWNYADPRASDVIEYCGVTQQIVACATARPKEFVQGVSSFLVIATPVEVSLHALCFEQGSDRLLPIQRTRHCVATDDVVITAITSDDITGRIFLGGADGCIHELHYFDDEPVWLGRPKKGRRTVVRSTFSSHFPAVLKKITERIANWFSSPSHAIVQLTVDAGRGLLYALTTASSIMVFQIPPSRLDSNGRLEEPPVEQVGSYFHYQMEQEAARIRGQLFPGLAARSSLSSQPFSLTGGGGGGFGTSPANPLLYPGMRRDIKVVKLLPVGRPQGGDVALCVVAEDGTRFFLRLMYARPMFTPGGGPPGMAPGQGGTNPGSPLVRPPAVVGLAVHHARFADLSGLSTAVSSAVPQSGLFGGATSLPGSGVMGTSLTLRVKDAAETGGVTLLLCQVPSSAAPAPATADIGNSVVGGAPAGSSSAETAAVGQPQPLQSYTDVIVAISTDLRATAQRQSRGRCPWLSAPPGLAEHMEVLRPSDSCQAVALAALASPLPWALRCLYGGVARGGSGTVAASSSAAQPVLGLSELAQQQLLPPPRFMLVSNFGVHVLSKVRPVEVLRQQLERGDLAALRDFSLQNTAEQMAALCFQVLTGVVPKLSGHDGYATDSVPNVPGYRGAPGQEWNPLGGGGGRAGQRLASGGVGRDFGRGSALSAGSSGGSLTAASRDRRSPPQGNTSSPASGWRDEAEEVILYRAEQLLISPQLAPQVGFLQAWPNVEARGPEQGSGAPAWSPSMGWAVRTAGSQRLSGRLRGLCLYLSRLLRPLWLAPVMAVTWPARSPDAMRGMKRRLGDWWPPTPEPAPSVHGAQWRCSWNKAQRSHVQGQLTRLSAVLERVKVCLQSDPRNVAGGAASASALRAAQFRGGYAGQANQNAGQGEVQEDEAVVAAYLSELLSTAVEALSFLDLVATRTHTLASAPCPPEVLVRFAEFSFRDLVCQPDVRKVLQQLMQGGVVACRPLHARCPRLFSAGDLEVQEACELLANVQSNIASASQGMAASAQGGASVGMDAVRLGFLVQKALRTLDRHAAKVDLQEVTARLRTAGAFKGLVALCTRVAQARDPNDECLRPQDPSSARVQQLHYARLECYQVVLAVLEDLFLRSQQNQTFASPTQLRLQGGADVFGTGEQQQRFGLGPREARAGEAHAGDLQELIAVPVAARDALPTLDTLLRHCLEAHAYLADELFHFCILKWMMQRGLPAYRYDSPYLKGYLETRAQDQPELLCRYFQHRGRWAEAYDAYMALAQSSPSTTSREERLVLLQSAAMCARMPGTNRRVEPVLRAIEELRGVEPHRPMDRI